MLFPRRNMHSQLLRGLALAGLAAVSLAESVLSWRGVNGSCPGEAFKRPSVTSLEQCQRLCEGQERCRGVTYHRLSQACELLSHAEESDARCYNEHHVEVFVMMPLDLVSLDGTLQQDQLDQIWPALKTSQADGFMVDVWWGITEPSPKQYDFSAYRKLFDQAKSHGFKVQAVTSFHQCGNNVGDDCYIPIPEFVRKVPSIWYKDFKGQETQEYISLFADEVPVTDEKRTPLEMYGDWFEAFRKEFQKDLGDPIVEIMVGLGPCGEMRYPSYRLDKWAFPGIGSFQCFDDHALKSLRTAMDDPSAMPPKVDYNSRAEDAGSFFAKDTSSNYASADGRRFLDWYSGSLKHHATAVLQLAQKTFPKKVRLAAKISGVHWWYDSPSHAAEVTAGYYNTNGHDAYKEIAEVLQKAGTDVYDFTCLEMRDEEQPGNALSSPERLVKQSQQAAAAASLHFAGENALERYDQHAYDQMLVYQESLYGLTFLRMTKKLMQSDNLQRFRCFVLAMQGKPTSDCDNLPPSRPEPDFGPVLLLVAALLLLGLLVFAWLLRRARRLETERRRLETETVEIGGVSRF